MPRRGRTTPERGYGYAHQATRKRWATIVDQGNARCSRCGGTILPGTPWDLDHTDDRTAYAGPAHRYCNRRAGALKGNRSPLRRTRGTSVRW